MQRGVPAEVGVPIEVDVRPQRSQAGGEGSGASHAGQQREVQEALLRQQLLVGQEVGEGEDVAASAQARVPERLVVCV